ncbi:Fic family protein [Pandoraea sp. ISTKB]|uniref:Fic family protein n=1 Tax=Pandoraea sp. ISTKB TaxID=1586708 RepID=UPI00148170B4|nr:Fic family protein [Pandoraea sp. ISTKB]
MRATIDASPRTRAVAQQQALAVPSASPPRLTTPPPLSSPAPIQRVVNFSADVERQYTKNTFLTKLKHVSGLTFDEIRRTWIAAETSAEHITLPDNIELAWAMLARFQPSQTSPSASTSKGRGRKAPVPLPEYPKDDTSLLDAAAEAIPMTSRFDVAKHQRAISEHVTTIFPYAREESEQAQRPWNPEEPGEFEEHLPTVDFTTWDNLENDQRKLLRRNRYKPDVLMGELKRLVGHTPDENNDYLIALYSHLAALRGDARAVGEEAGLADKGAYVQKIVDLRSGKALDDDTYRPSSFSRVSSVDWTERPELTEDHPFLRQRHQQVYKHLDAKHDRNALDILTKWASPATGVQKHNVGMDVGISTKSQTPKHAGDDIALLDSTLARIAPIEGTLYAAYPRNDTLKVGNLFSQGTPLSASESAGGTVAFSKGGMKKKGAQVDRYRIYAKGVSGIPISPVAPDVGHGQREVVFRASATFKVLAIQEGNFGAGATRLVTMVEQGESTSHVDAVKQSQQALLNRNDRWLTRLGDVDIDPRIQSWYISNSTGGTVEGQPDASFAFPYGKKTAQAWHDVITDNGIDIWTIDGFRSVAARLSGEARSGVEFITEKDEPSFWGAPAKLTRPERKALKGHGLSVTNAEDDPSHSLFNVSYRQEDKASVLGEMLAQSKKEFDAILAPKPKPKPQRGRKVDPEAEKEAAIARLAAQVQQQISVLHPLHDANGRVSRAYAYLILRRAGYGDKPLRLFDQDKDQITSREDWANQFAGYQAEEEDDWAPSTGLVTDMEGAHAFISSLAGGNMSTRLLDVEAEEQRLSAQSDVEDADMWIEQELLTLAFNLPPRLQPEFGDEMNAFVAADLERREAEQAGTNKKKGRKHVSPSTKRQRYAYAVELKQRLTIAISNEIQRELSPPSPKPSTSKLLPKPRVTRALTPKQTPKQQPTSSRTPKRTLTPISMPMPDLTPDPTPKPKPKRTPKAKPKPKPKPKSKPGSLNRKRNLDELVSSSEDTSSESEDDEAYTPVRRGQRGGNRQARHDWGDEESEEYDDPKDDDYEPEKQKKGRWN